MHQLKRENQELRAQLAEARREVDRVKREYIKPAFDLLNLEQERDASRAELAEARMERESAVDQLDADLKRQLDDLAKRYVAQAYDLAEAREQLAAHEAEENRLREAEKARADKAEARTRQLAIGCRDILNATSAQHADGIYSSLRIKKTEVYGGGFVIDDDTT